MDFTDGLKAIKIRQPSTPPHVYIVIAGNQSLVTAGYSVQVLSVTSVWEFLYVLISGHDSRRYSKEERSCTESMSPRFCP